MTLSVTPITPAIGGLVSGIDLAQPLDDGAFGEIVDALHDRLVLLFRGQDISEEQHRDFAARFGPLHHHPIYPHSSQVPEIMLLDSAVNDLRDNALWHSDVSFNEIPPLGSVLVARMIPETGGDTLWTSAVAAYDELPDQMKADLAGMTAKHDIAKSFPAERFGTDPAALEQLESAKRNNPAVTHPVIRTHPVTGRKAVYVNEGITTSIDGLESDASDALLDKLFRHVTKPEFAMRWHWQEGDVAIWDNRVTQHYACDDYRPQRRVMHRATMIGDRPF
jgi:taurine dioxygenase